MAHTRSTDDTASTVAFKFDRNIPFTWLIGGAGTFMVLLGAQAVAMYYGQERLTEKMTEVVLQMASTTVEVRNLASVIGKTSNAQDMLDFRLNLVERRMAELNAARAAEVTTAIGVTKKRP